MKPYSLDIRQKIIDTYQEGEISQRQLAKRFRVTLSFIQKLLKQYRETGTIAPKVRTQQTPTKLNAEQMATLETLVNDNNDATLAELREQLHQITGVLIGRSTVDRMLRKLNITRKKKACTRPKKRVNACKTNEQNTGSRFGASPSRI